MAFDISKLDIAEVMTKARLHLMFDGHMFYAALAFHLVPVLVEDEQLTKRIWRGQKPTMATDGRNLYYHKDFFSLLDKDNWFKQLQGVIAHEALHYGLSHVFRIGERDMALWNYACDIVINYHVKAAGLMLPSDHIHINDPKVQKMFKPLPKGTTWAMVESEWSAEQIFDHFDQDKCGGSKAQMPGWGIVIKPEGGGSGQDGELTEGDMMELDAQARDALTQAAASAKMAGKGAGSLEGVINEMMQPQVDWRAVMQRFVSRVVPFDYSWKRPNRRHVSANLYLPTNKKRDFGTLLIINDTSGSVSDNEQKHFLAEINAITTMFQFERVITMPCDYAVHEKGIMYHKPGDVITTLRVDGRGGTSFKPPFEWLKNHPEVKPTCIIYLTDLEGDFPPECDVPTLWVATTKHKAPWGETVRIDCGRGR